MPSRRPRESRCQACSAPLGTIWVEIRSGGVPPGRHALCRNCTEDTLTRWDLEATQQLAELESALNVPFSAIGPDEGDDEIGGSRR